MSTRNPHINLLLSLALAIGSVPRRSAGVVANESPPATESGGSVSNVVSPSIDGALTDDGSQVRLRIPYGEFLNVNDRGKTVVQVVNKDAAETMAGVFANNASFIQKVIKRMGVGFHRRSDVPLYVGHPDDPNSGDTDERAYGWLQEIVANEDHMELRYDLNEPGKALIASKQFRFYSPRWDTQAVSNRSGAVSPFLLMSVGLTNRHAIPVEPLSNEERREGESEAASNCCSACGCNPMEKEDDERRTVREKLYLEKDATMEQVVLAIEQRMLSARQAEADVMALRQQLADEQKARQAAVDMAAASNSQLTELTSQLAVSNQERSQFARLHVEAELKAIQASGRILPAQFELLREECCALSNADLTARLETLRKVPAVMKTGRITDDAAKGRESMVSNSDDAVKARTKLRSEFISEFMQRHTHMPTAAARELAWSTLAQNRPELLP